MSGLGRGQSLHLRLFIEGVEVPVIGAMISASENSPAAGQIEIIPTDTAMRLKARSKVHLFFLDYAGTYSGPTMAEELKLKVNTSGGLPDSSYKLLFGGEIFTMMFTKSGPGSRSLVLQCLDDSNMWDTAYLYMMRYEDANQESVYAGSQKTFMALNNTAVQFDDIMNSPELVIAGYLHRQAALSPALQSSEGLLGGLFGILELIGGVEGKYVGITDWHTIQEARVRMLDQIAGDSGDTAAKLFDLASFEGWLTKSLGQQGAVISFREIIGLINSYIYYSVFPNPVGRYISGTRTKIDWPEGIGGFSSFGNSLDPELDVQAQQIEDILKEEFGWDGTNERQGLAYRSSAFRTLEQANRLREATGAAPVTNKATYINAHAWGLAVDIALKSYTGLGMGMVCGRKPAKSMAEATSGLHHRLITAATIYNWTSLAQVLASSLFTDDEKDLILENVRFYKDYKTVVSRPEFSNLNWGGTWPGKDAFWRLSGIDLGWDPVHVQFADWRARIQQYQGSGAVTQDVTTPADLESFYESLPERDRLITQHFRPDVWFVAPPACNIIFPEELSSFSYTRQMMRETTRHFLMTFNAMYQDMLLTNTYFAPIIEELQQNLEVEGIGSAKEAFIYPHEIYSGVIPKMERLSEAAFYSKLPADSELKVGEEFPEEEQLLQDTSTQIEVWAARTAAFNFLSYRYAARSIVASGRFMPRLACGWPAVVIDKPVDADYDPQVAANSLITPINYLGIIKSLSHSVTQSGGSTSVTLSHGRSHKAGDETDDLFSKTIYAAGATLSVQVDRGTEKTTEIVVNTDMSREDYVFCLRLARHLEAGGSLDPAPKTWENGHAAVGPTGEPLSSIEAQLYYEDADAEDAGTATNAIEGSTSSGSVHLFPFEKVTVVETTPGSSEVTPLEEAIRPPWFSDEYSNENIGNHYQKLLGCSSILELAFEQGATGSPSVAVAVETIANRYSQIVQGNGGADAFISATTDRAYASLSQVLGSEDAPGFHYYSCGDYSGLEGTFYSWMSEGSATDQNKQDEPRTVDPALDPRAGRYRAAMEYQATLLQSHGIRG